MKWFLHHWKKYSTKYRIENKIKKILILPVLISIKAYQFILSPVLGPSCRFYPTCSEYAYQAIKRHGLIKGIYLAIKRIVRCHPYNAGGIDHVP